MGTHPRSIILATLLLLAAGCGSRQGDGSPSDVGGGDGSDAPVIATLGDSITAGSPLWDPDEDVRARLRRTDPRSQWQRWVQSDARFRNCGVWGERTDAIAERYEACVEDAEAVVIQGGINDIAQGRSVESAARNLACIAERARGDGLRIALVELLPWNRGYPEAADDVEALNEAIHEIARRGGVPVLPFHELLEDPDARGRMQEALTSDGSHPNVAGYRRLGREAWREPVLAEGSFQTACEDGVDA